MEQAPNSESNTRVCGPGTCVRCRSRQVTGSVELCPSCATETRVEFAAGLRRLTEYLGRWAAFDEWCREAGVDPACA
jgi:hypothetical protein